MEPNAWIILALYFFGFVLMTAELFVPSGGILTLGSIACLIGAIVLCFQYSTPVGLAAVAATAIAVPVFLVMLVRIWPRTPLGRLIHLKGRGEAGIIGAASPKSTEMPELLGKKGRAIGGLRPVGTCEVAGKRVDAHAESGMIEPGTPIRVVDVRDGNVIVRPDV